jgi:putative hydrolase of the HAD superfamily
MKRSTEITTLFLDVGDVLLNDGWDHHARRRAAKNFKLPWAEMEKRHLLTFETHEEGKLTFEEYLNRVVFYEKRTFTRAQFRRFMFAQSKACPGMIDLVSQLKERYRLKIAVVSNESREVNAYRIPSFLPASFTFASPMLTSFDSRWISPRRKPGMSSTSKTHRCSFRSRKV